MKDLAKYVIVVLRVSSIRSDEKWFDCVLTGIYTMEEAEKKIKKSQQEDKKNGNANYEYRISYVGDFDIVS